MKVKVIKQFIDLKNNNKLREVGEVYTTTKERAEEINSTLSDTYVEEVKEKKKVKEGAENEGKRNTKSRKSSTKSDN